MHIRPPQSKAQAIASAKQILGVQDSVFKLPDIAVPTSLYERSFAKNWTLCDNAKGRGICSNEHGEMAPLSAEASAVNEATLLKSDHRVTSEQRVVRYMIMLAYLNFMFALLPSSKFHHSPLDTHHHRPQHRLACQVFDPPAYDRPWRARRR